MRRSAGALAGVLLAVAGGHARAGEVGPVVAGPRDKCPVCGMFVARYPEWLAAVRFADGTHAVFDGAKDLFRFLAAPGEYAPQRSAAEVRAILVTDYYAVRQVDARTAWFVLGSDVLGPMGHELVPFEAERDAREFMADHHGRRLLRFGDVTPAVLRELE
jgi:nitrous oxide reductase accessory protein NosL